MGIEVLATGAALAGSGLAGSYMQSEAMRDANAANVAMQRDANRQNEALTRESWSRDDNAVQRRKADLLAAGINPNLAAGSAAGTTTPARMESTRVEANTAMGQGVSNLGNVGRTMLATDMAMAQTNLIKNQAQTEQAKYVQSLSAAERDMAQANALRSELPSKIARNQSTAFETSQRGRVGKKDADYWVDRNIDVRDRDAVSKVLKQFPEATQKLRGYVGDQIDDPGGYKKLLQFRDNQEKSW